MTEIFYNITYKPGDSIIEFINKNIINNGCCSFADVINNFNGNVVFISNINNINYNSIGWIKVFNKDEIADMEPIWAIGHLMVPDAIHLNPQDKSTIINIKKEHWNTKLNKYDYEFDIVSSLILVFKGYGNNKRNNTKMNNHLNDISDMIIDALIERHRHNDDYTDSQFIDKFGELSRIYKATKNAIDSCDSRQNMIP
jgi:hypothetical protein